jgi:hypothetical protein
VSSRRRGDVPHGLTREERALLDVIARLAVEDALSAQVPAPSVRAATRACGELETEAKVVNDDDA